MTHLAERVIQECALGERQASALEKEHLDLCPECQKSYHNYRSLFSTIPAVEKPQFPFDLATLVMDHLPAPESRCPWLSRRWWIIWAGTFGLFLVTVLITRSYLNTLSHSVSLIAVCLVGAGVGALGAVQVRDLYRAHSSRLHQLDRMALN